MALREEGQDVVGQCSGVQGHGQDSRTGERAGRRRGHRLPGRRSRDDFARARRNAILRRLAARLRLRSGDLDVLLPFDEVVGALGHQGERPLGLQQVELDSIVGSTDRWSASTAPSARRRRTKAGFL